MSGDYTPHTCTRGSKPCNVIVCQDVFGYWVVSNGCCEIPITYCPFCGDDLRKEKRK